MTTERKPNIQQQVLFDIAIDELMAPNPSSVDIENALKSVPNLLGISIKNTKTLLDLAKDKSALWTRAVGPELVIDAVITQLDVYGEWVKRIADPKRDAEYVDAASNILAGVFEADKDAYTASFSGRLKGQGSFGEYGPSILGGVVKKLSQKMDKDGSIWFNKETDNTNLIQMLGDLQGMGNEEVIEDVKSALPAQLLYLDPVDRIDLSPEMNQLLESARRGNDPEINKLVQLYLNQEDNEQDRLKERILANEFGDSIKVADRMISTIMVERDKVDEEEREEIDGAAYDLWLDLLDKDPQDKKLRPITANVIELNQYWRDEDLVYTCMESIKRLGFEGEEESFVEKYKDKIQNNLGTNVPLSEDQQKRIVRFLEELGRIERDRGQNLHSNLLDADFLLAIL